MKIRDLISWPLTEVDNAHSKSHIMFDSSLLQLARLGHYSFHMLPNIVFNKIIASISINQGQFKGNCQYIAARKLDRRQ